MPTEDSTRLTPNEAAMLRQLEEWLQSPAGAEQMEKALEDSDKLAALIQREASKSPDPEIRSRSRLK